MATSKSSKREETKPVKSPQVSEGKFDRTKSTGSASVPVVVPSESDATASEASQPRVNVQLLRGMKDIVPSEQPYWDHLRTITEDIARAYGYGRIDSPILEETGLFTRAVGRATDIVEKEMFSFDDQGGDHVSLRPEATASIVRAYIEHGMVNQPQPIKLWYFGPMFRYDRPQAGRLRQFHQFGLEVLGEKHPAVDAELILMGSNIFQSLGIPANVQLNSIGCALCRPTYEIELTNYLKTRRTDLCETCRRRMGRSTLRIFDCKEPGCQAVKESAPQIVDWLCEECKQHFIRVLEYLDELDVSYELSPFLVRGLDYYSKTVFEFIPTNAGENAQASLAGGGRYDGLVEILGGRPTPAAGIAFGLERLILKMKEAIADGRLAPFTPNAQQVYLAQLGDQAKRKAMRLFEQLRNGGFPVAANFAKDSLKAQLEQANRLNVRLTLILGQKEVIDGTIIIREMSSGIQEIVAYDKVVAEVKKRLEQDTVRESKTDIVVPVDADVAGDEPRGKKKDDLPPPPTIEDYEDDGAKTDESPPEGTRSAEE